MPNPDSTHCLTVIKQFNTLWIPTIPWWSRTVASQKPGRTIVHYRRVSKQHVTEPPSAPTFTASPALITECGAPRSALRLLKFHLRRRSWCSLIKLRRQTLTGFNSVLSNLPMLLALLILSPLLAFGASSHSPCTYLDGEAGVT